MSEDIELTTDDELDEEERGIDAGKLLLTASILLFAAVILWLAYPNTNLHYHLVLTGMSKGRVWPYNAKFKPYIGKRMGGFAGVSTVIKETAAGFNGDPYNIFSLGGELSGTADAYFSGGSSVVAALNMIGVDAMLLGNMEFSFGKERLEELSNEANFWFISSNITDESTKMPPSFAVPEMYFSPGKGLKIGVMGITPPATPNLTALSNVSGLAFAAPNETLAERVANMRRSGADLVVLLTMFRPDRIKHEEWQPIAQAAPDVCLMIDYDIEEPRVLRKDGVVIKTISGYNQTKEVDVLDLELSQKPVRVISWKSSRIPVNHAEIEADPKIKSMLSNLSWKNRAYRDTVIGQFKNDCSRNWDLECPINDMVCDAMLAEIPCDIAINNSGGVRSNIQSGDFTINDLFSLMPFDNQVVTMEMTGKDLRELFAISASLQRGILQVAGADYTFKSRHDRGSELISLNIGGKPVEDGRLYRVCTNSFLADGGDRYVPFKKGIHVRRGDQQRDIVKRYITDKSKSGPLFLAVSGRINRVSASD